MLRDAWRLALGTLTAVPVTPPATVDRQRARVAMVVAPLATIPLALGLVVVAGIGAWVDLPPLVVALLALGVTIIGNRGFHLDGLSDVVDGMAASFDRERSLAVMKSGTAGPAGVVAIVLVVGIQAAALGAILADGEWTSAVLAGAALCVSRAALAICCARGFAPARQDGLGRLYTQTVPRWAALAIWLVAAAVLAVLGERAGLEWWRGAIAAGVAAATVLVVVRRAVTRFGGVTGDVFGASIELAFAAMLVVLA
jgi:adenosylcobinamide-GDP ribazoletransferase